MTRLTGFRRTGDEKDDEEYISYKLWRTRERDGVTGSVETLSTPIDKYELYDFATDDFPRFAELVEHLSPRDAEIMHCFAVLQMRPTDLSILFGKAGHRAEEDLHKAAHKLAGLIAFGPSPGMSDIDPILQRYDLGTFGHHSFSACLWEYSRSRDFAEVSRLIGGRTRLRQQMWRAFKVLHATDDRQAGLLAGWILWLVDGSNPKGKGWQKRQKNSRARRLGPTTFTTRIACELTPRATGKGGQGQRPDTAKITRQMKFLLRD